MCLHSLSGNGCTKFGKEALAVAFFLAAMSIPGPLVGPPLTFNLAPQKSVSVDDVRQDLRQARREIELLKTMVRQHRQTELDYMHENYA